MAINPATFRTNFAAFANNADYPDAMVQMWLTEGYRRCPSAVWQSSLDMGVQLFAAHNLVLERRNARAGAYGATPGQDVGPLNNKSVSKESAGYDTAAGSIENAGNYNLTNYGTRFKELSNIVGSGGRQLGIGCSGSPLGMFPYF